MDPDDDADPRSGVVSEVMHTMAEALRPLVSKRAQKIYLGAFLFFCTAIAMIVTSTVAYGVFYYRFIPQAGLERIVHLQFGEGPPWGVTSLGSDLVPSLPYDVQVELELPRTPSNLAAGNFMLDLALLSRPSTSAAYDTNTSVTTLSHSRRPAILTYTSPLVDTASKISFMPLYVLGWHHEAEKLQVPMMERVQFARGWRNIPGSLRLELHSSEIMQVYKAKVTFRARFTGLRWVMYNWRLTSFVVFGFLFWSVSMASTGLAWVVFASLLSSRGDTSGPVVKKEDRSATPIIKKEEEVDEPLFHLPIAESSKTAEKRRVTGPEEAEKEEDEEDNGGIADEDETDEDNYLYEEDAEDGRGEGPSEASGTGTARESAHARGVVNDDGPPSNQSSPYIHSFVQSLQSAGHIVSVVLPHQQRSWIGKAHLIGAAVKPTYFRPGTLHKDDGTTHEFPHGMNEGDDDSYDGDEWILVDSTPASCVQIGLYHYFQDRGPIDLVVSGPNYGRNSTALFALSSGTIGGAMEAAVCGKPAIALSYAFSSRDHDPVVIAEASRHSVRLIEYLHKNWADGVDLYTVNVPLEPGVSQNKVLYTNMLDNRWSSGSCFRAVDASASANSPEKQEHDVRHQTVGSGEKSAPAVDGTTPLKRSRIQHKHFEWAPNFSDVYRSVEEGAPGNDGWAVKEGMTSVTPLRANFMHTPGIQGEITLPDNNTEPTFYSLVDSDDSYVQSLMERALQRRLGNGQCRAISSLSDLPSRTTPIFQYREYERLDFEHTMMHTSTSLANAYIIRKALIRKHYLSNTVINWVTKHPDSVLAKHFKPGFDFELDYAEFLDDALLEAYELRESLAKNETLPDEEKEWWILKPGMSDRGQGIRLFNSEDGLREIFEEWEVPDSDDESGSERPEPEDNDEDDDNHGVVTSQLRHFIAQPYIDPPLLIPSSHNRKFHIRTYILAVGSLKIYVFKEMLALFAAKPYCPPFEDEDEVTDLARHLTNTCFQENGRANPDSVRRFWSLEDYVPGLSDTWKQNVFDQICAVSGEIFEAAARGMMVHFQTLPNAFELFGVDFLVDKKGNAWLLELNAYPDFAQTGEDLKELVVGKLFEETVDVAVKPFFGLQEDGEDVGKGTEMLKLVRDVDLGRKA
ncbi:hypothetical protein AnigIFM56816_000349 [Aspergillus niger]|nr:hypothetical protein AnigIFM56816_000349 [Aspergillus niger]